MIGLLFCAADSANQPNWRQVVPLCAKIKKGRRYLAIWAAALIIQTIQLY